MMKLFKNEFRRFRSSLLILLICAGVLALVTFLSLILAIVIGQSEPFNKMRLDSSTFGTQLVLLFLMMYFPYSGLVYTIISFVTDLGQKGMIFLTPTPTWKIVLSKILFGIGVAAAFFLITDALTLLVTLPLYTVTKSDDVLSVMLELHSWMEDGILAWLKERGRSMADILYTMAAFLAGTALARTAAHSTSAQVMLTLVFYSLINMMQTLLWSLINFAVNGENWMAHLIDMLFENNPWEMLFRLVLVVPLYFLCVILTEKKVNLH